MEPGQLQREATLFQAKGYTLAAQSEAGSHLNAGRLLMTGGLSILAGRGGTRSKGATTVTFTGGLGRRQAPAPSMELPRPAAPAAAAPVPPPSDVLERLTALADLRDRGLVTEDDFASKKADLVRAFSPVNSSVSPPIPSRPDNAAGSARARRVSAGARAWSASAPRHPGRTPRATAPHAAMRCSTARSSRSLIARSVRAASSSSPLPVTVAGGRSRPL